MIWGEVDRQMWSGSEQGSTLDPLGILVTQVASCEGLGSLVLRWISGCRPCSSWLGPLGHHCSASVEKLGPSVASPVPFLHEFLSENPRRDSSGSSWT